MIYSNNAECGEIFSLQSLFSTVQVEKFRNYEKSEKVDACRHPDLRHRSDVHIVRSE